MVDRISEEKRSWIMGRIKAKDTAPELVVRKFLYRNGFRYILHANKLPGKPDLLNARRKIAVFVNGCFWHHHVKCKRGKWPKSNEDYWIPKIKNNVKNDKLNQQKLHGMGYMVFTIWECEVNKVTILNKLLNDIKSCAGIAINDDDD